MGLFDRFTRKRQAESNDSSDGDASSNDVSGLGGAGGLISPSTNPERTLEALELMADRLYRSCWKNDWVHPSVPSEDWVDEVITGVSIRSQSGQVLSAPIRHAGFKAFEDAFWDMNMRVAIKTHSKAVDFMFRNHLDVAPQLNELFINADSRIQVLDTISDLRSARKNQYAAFVRDEGVLCVWADDVAKIVPMVDQLEHALVSLIWAAETGMYSPTPSTYVPTLSHNTASIASERELIASDKEQPSPQDDAGGDVEDPVKAQVMASRRERRRVFISTLNSGCSVALAIIIMGFGLRSLIVRYSYDGDASRFALVAVLFVEVVIIAFPCSVLISNILQLFGPISQFHRNTRTFSAIPPVRGVATRLSPITVQMPVYKEDLEGVIKPTIDSLKKAITVYERQGGSVNVIICEDGLQLFSEEERQRRMTYYKMNNVGYVSRPPHGQDGYLRRGRFKKAGNLNFCNTLSWRVEDIMDELRPSRQLELGLNEETWTERHEHVVYEEALRIAVDETEGKAWADGNIRIGEILLLIDSDTRVPEDCFMDASLEMLFSPEVAILQHESGVMQVAHHYFENGIAFFTRQLQLGISLTVANGDSAPFVGHNAFLRWSALQECATIDPFDDKPRIWFVFRGMAKADDRSCRSENHVSEDFQVSLSLQSRGWIIRWATYSNSAFEEGVSLTCNDERARWQKYAWGCSEIVFNPFRYWPTRGPFTKLFRTFLWSNLSHSSKWNISGYIFSYYAIAFGWIGPIINFFILGVFGIQDDFYVTSWQVFFVCTLLFAGLSNVSSCILRYRLKLAHTGAALIETIKWIPFFALFFVGISFSISCALVAHLFSINMSWTSTSKSVEKSNFFRQVPVIFKLYWGQITLSIVLLAGMIVSTTSIVPANYRVYDFEVIMPLSYGFGCHLAWPFLLNPFFLTFTF